MDRKHSVDSLWKILIPILLTGIFGAYNMVKMMQEGTAFEWQHYTAIAGFIVVIVLIFINTYSALLATGIFIVLAIVNVISISYGIVNVGMRIGSFEIPFGQPLAWLMLVVYGIFHLESLYNYYLDHKQKSQIK